MTHVADIGGGAAGGRPSAQTGRTFEIDRTVETDRSKEPLRPATDTGRTVEKGRTSDTDRPPEHVRPAMTTGRPTETGPSAENVRPLEAGRAGLERRRTTETRDPNGASRRRAEQERLREVDDTVHRRDTETPRNGRSYGWLWALPLAALAGLGLYYLSERPDDRTVTATGDVIPSARDTAAAIADLKGSTLNAIGALTTAMQGIKDSATATAEMPRIQDAAKDMERVAVQAAQLPASARTALADATRQQIGKLNTLIDTASGIPGVGPQLQQMTSTIRGRMDAIAMVPGRPLFMTSAPGEWIWLSSVQNREVLNRAGERVGTASGFFVGPDGKLVAALVSVDRQLGIGEKQIGMSFAGGKLEQRADGWHLVIDTTKDDLQRAKAFEPAK
jgi:hypothetical protein